MSTNTLKYMNVISEIVCYGWPSWHLDKSKG